MRWHAFLSFSSVWEPGKSLKRPVEGLEDEDGQPITTYMHAAATENGELLTSVTVDSEQSTGIITARLHYRTVLERFS